MMILTTAARKIAGFEKIYAFLPGMVHAPYEANLNEPKASGKPTKSMYVDVVNCEAGVPRVTFDAKCKASHSGSYSNADEYRMLAYRTALDLHRRGCTMPMGENPKLVKARNTNKEIVHFPLDLSLSPERLMERLQIVANLARNLTASTYGLYFPSPLFDGHRGYLTLRDRSEDRQFWTYMKIFRRNLTNKLRRRAFDCQQAICSCQTS